MKTLWLLIPLLASLGCAADSASLAREHQRNLNECRSIAADYGIQGNVLQQYMTTCMHMTVAASPRYVGTQSFDDSSRGPYGSRGPSWSQLNYAYQFGVLSPFQQMTNQQLQLQNQIHNHQLQMQTYQQPAWNH